MLYYLTCDDASPTKDVDRLHVRDNLKIAITDAESSKGNAILRAAGKGLKQGKQIASKTAEVVSEKTVKYTDEAWKASEKYMEIAMQHWKQKMGQEWALNLKGSNNEEGGGGGGGGGVGGKFSNKNHERPIVLRKRRQRISTKLNWPLFYYMFNQNHAKPNLIWNIKVCKTC